jgi:uncharacterized protein (TIGR03435 family)
MFRFSFTSLWSQSTLQKNTIAHHDSDPFVKAFKTASLLFLIMTLSLCDSLAIADKDGPAIGNVPPTLTLTKTIQGTSATDLTWEKLKGKVVVLEFWATWCGPCVKAIPHMNDLVDQFTNRPVVFISVTSENEDVVRLFLKNRPIHACVGFDDYEVLNKAFHVQGIPHAVIVDATGRIAAITHPANIKPGNLEEVLAGKKCSLPPPEVYTLNNLAGDIETNQAPALFEISIREHKMPAQIRGPICRWSTSTNHSGFSGRIATVESALNCVFAKSPTCRELNCRLPDGYYDFELRCPPNHAGDLQDQFIAALRTTFGLDVKLVTKTMDVYVLTQAATDAPSLQPVTEPGGGGQMAGGFRFSAADLKTVASYLEMALAKPVFDESGLTGLFAVDMKWKLAGGEGLWRSLDRKARQAIEAHPDGDWLSALPPELRPTPDQVSRIKAELAKPDNQQFLPDPDAVITAARERLGLQLTLTQRPVEILEVNPVTSAPLP